MAALQQGFRAGKTVWNGARSALREYQRWRGGATHPTLQFQLFAPPYWGATKLTLTVRNTGRRAARDCRYGRYHLFSMSGAAPGSRGADAVAWYVTDTFTVPAGGSLVVQAHASDDSCSAVILHGLVRSGRDQSSVEAIVCRDKYGTLYRFTADQGDEPEIWRGTTLDFLLKRQPPAWTAWVEHPADVQNKIWNSSFRRAGR